VEEHSAPVYKWRLLPGFWVKNGFSPRRNQLLPYVGVHLINGSMFSQQYHLQGSLPSVCTAMSVHLPSYLSCLVSSSLTYHIQLYKLHSYIHTIIHSYINTFTYSYIHAYTSYTQHQFIHGCISHLEFCLVGPLWVRSSLIIVFKRQVPTNEQLEPFQKCHPSVSSQEMSLINHFKWQVPKNKQLEPFQKCQPQCVWSIDVTNQ